MISRTAELIFEGFCKYKTKFDDITINAQARFEKRQWSELQTDVAHRLYLHKNEVYATADQLKEYLKGEEVELRIWHEVHNEYARLVIDRPDHELSYTFFFFCDEKNDSCLFSKYQYHSDGFEKYSRRSKIL